jgi:flagellar biosynthetic protein FliP
MPADIVDKVQSLGVLQNISPPLQTALFLSGLVLIPSLLVCVTGFTRIVIVLGFARRAVTSQDIPGNQVLLGLSLFLTLFVMGPTWDELEGQALGPYFGEKISGAEAISKGTAIMTKFMLRQTRKEDLKLFIEMAQIESPNEPGDTPLRVLVPSFVISELKTAFIMGFCIYLPFLLVDLVVSSVLTAMGMVMMPPVVVSAPFKVLLFVLADGWHLVVQALGASFA